jgi:hypothetical protein
MGRGDVTPQRKWKNGEDLPRHHHHHHHQRRRRKRCQRKKRRKMMSPFSLFSSICVSFSKSRPFRFHWTSSSSSSFLSFLQCLEWKSAGLEKTTTKLTDCRELNVVLEERNERKKKGRRVKPKTSDFDRIRRMA